MIGEDEHVLYLTRRTESSVRRVRVGEVAHVVIGRSRLRGEVVYVATEQQCASPDHVTLWVRVPVIDCPLPLLD